MSEGRPREDVDLFGASPFWLWVGGTSAAGLAATVVAAATLHPSHLVGLSPAFWVIAGLVVLAEARPLLTPGNRDSDGLVTSIAAVFAILISVGLAPAVLLQVIATLVADKGKRKSWWRAVFNASQYVLSLSAAGAVLALTGVSGTLGRPAGLAGSDLPAVVLAAVAYFVVNQLLVGVAVALHERRRLATSLRAGLAFDAVSTAALLSLSPLVVLVIERSVWFVPLLVLPVVAVYQSARGSAEQEHRSTHDDLTGLANRSLLLHAAVPALEEATRRGEVLALLLLDLDRFKEVNDTLGHQVGDRLLVLVGERLQQASRGGDTVCRLGGDEFAVLLPVVDDAATAVAVARRITASLAEPYLLDGLVLDLDASVGVALHPDHGQDFETLLARADVAMYAAKEARTGVELYSADQDRNSTARLGLLGELRRVLATPGGGSGELVLHYQPKADLATGRVEGVEALVRWQHPARGLISPDEFVPLAEQTGLVRQLTERVLDLAVRQSAQWAAAGLEPSVAVNVSVRDLHGVGFAAWVAGLLAEHGVPPGRLVLEITESGLMADPVRATTTLRELADLGVGLSLDDFGTGYSSLAHLRRLPVSEVKIDRSFVHGMADDPDDARIVRTIVELGAALGLRVVAEGVEDAACWHSLAALGCDQAQGWYLAPPMGAATVTGWLRESSRRSALAAAPD